MIERNAIQPDQALEISESSNPLSVPEIPGVVNYDYMPYKPELRIIDTVQSALAQKELELKEAQSRYDMLDAVYLTVIMKKGLFYHLRTDAENAYGIASVSFILDSFILLGDPSSYELIV